MKTTTYKTATPGPTGVPEVDRWVQIDTMLREIPTLPGVFDYAHELLRLAEIAHGDEEKDSIIALLRGAQQLAPDAARCNAIADILAILEPDPIPSGPLPPLGPLEVTTACGGVMTFRDAGGVGMFARTLAEHLANLLLTISTSEQDEVVLEILTECAGDMATQLQQAVNLLAPLADTQRPPSGTQDKFAAGVQLAQRMAYDASLRVGNNGHEPRRYLRGGKDVDAFAGPYIAQVMADPGLLAGFAAVVSGLIALDGCEAHYFDVPVSEYLAGGRGEDGTEPGDTDTWLYEEARNRGIDLLADDNASAPATTKNKPRRKKAVLA